MAIFEIIGKTKLSGELKVSGAKNEVLKLIPLSLLIDGDLLIENAPNISDVAVQLEIFRSIGGTATFSNSSINLNSEGVRQSEIPIQLSQKLRASIVYAGVLLSRFKKAKIACPGGCVIGPRSIETHLDAFRQAGVRVEDEEGFVELDASDIPEQVEITMAEKSVTATENIILFFAKGKTRARIKNIAVEPEVMHLVEVINGAGGSISITGDNELEIIGVEKLCVEKVEALPDRIEAGTFAIALVATGGEGTISPYPDKYLETFTNKLIECGVDIKIENSKATISKAENLKPFEIETAPYPGFPTDLQSPMALIAAIAQGKSRIKETMFDNRLGYINELKEMGLDAEVIDEHQVEINGPTQFRPCTIESLDLRSGITVLIAALMADGKSILKKAEIVDRGYENIEKKLCNVGARITRYE